MGVPTPATLSTPEEEQRTPEEEEEAAAVARTIPVAVAAEAMVEAKAVETNIILQRRAVTVDKFNPAASRALLSHQMAIVLLNTRSSRMLFQSFAPTRGTMAWAESFMT